MITDPDVKADAYDRLITKIRAEWQEASEMVNRYARILDAIGYDYSFPDGYISMARPEVHPIDREDPSLRIIATAMLPDYVRRYETMAVLSSLLEEVEGDKVEEV